MTDNGNVYFYFPTWHWHAASQDDGLVFVWPFQLLHIHPLCMHLIPRELFCLMPRTSGHCFKVFMLRNCIHVQLPRRCPTEKKMRNILMTLVLLILIHFKHAAWNTEPWPSVDLFTISIIISKNSGSFRVNWRCNVSVCANTPCWVSEAAFILLLICNGIPKLGFGDMSICCSTSIHGKM